MRLSGRRTTRSENAEGVAGELRMYSMVHGSEMHMDGAAYVQEWRCVVG